MTSPIYSSLSGQLFILLLVLGEILTEPRRSSSQIKSGDNYDRGGQQYYNNYNNNNNLPDGCAFPSEWEGIWFQSTVRPYITIQGRSMSSKGKCVQSDRGREKFILQESQDCYKCVVFHQKAKNVLQYKETFGCSPLEDIDAMCRYIPGDANLYTMFRVDGSSVPCPFHGPLRFTYNRGKGDCDWPKSEMESCMDPHKLVFHYQACPNVQGSEMMTEELECQATWRDGSFHYLVGKMSHAHASSDEDKFRCFIFEFANPLVPSEGLQLAQSGDASCNGLFSPSEGSRTLSLSKGPSKVGCRFPQWLSANSKWNSLDGGRTLSLSVSPSNLSFIEMTFQTQGFGYSKRASSSVLCYKRDQSDSASRSSSSFLSSPRPPRPSRPPRPPPAPGVNGGPQSPIPSQNEVLQKDEMMGNAKAFDRSIEASYDRIVFYQTIGCRNGYVCSQLYKISGNVARIKMGKLSRTPEYACDKYHFDEDSLTPTLIVGLTPGENRYPITPALNSMQNVRLPFSGLFRISKHPCGWVPQFLSSATPTGLSSAEAVRQQSEADRDLNGAVSDSRDVGPFCKDGVTPRKLSVVIGCQPKRTYTCTHKWNEKGSQYLVFQPKSRPSGNEDEMMCFRLDGLPSHLDQSIPKIAPDRANGPGPMEMVMSKLDGNCLENITFPATNQSASSFSSSSSSSSSSSTSSSSLPSRTSWSSKENEAISNSANEPRSERLIGDQMILLLDGENLFGFRSLAICERGI
ncbi:hypothetical protein TCAL_00678 [Tigriopus californicus]|uniref:Chitin-binding type-2 domain-containing protein n=1 Tax=Tigriopus californicus TaxID=6832 RepID=A0A553PDZ5_TIGCA|nr:hypothetical protein TCAL_00678 [Tigriopus californicus]